MRRALLETIALAVLAAAAAVAWNAGRAERFPTTLPAAFFRADSGARPILTAQAGKLYAEGAIFLDARAPDEYAEGQIEGALNVPVEEWREIYPELSSWISGSKVIVYADPDRVERADDLARALLSRGAPRESLFVLIEGIDAWRRAGLPSAEGEDRVLGSGLGSDEEMEP